MFAKGLCCIALIAAATLASADATTARVEKPGWVLLEYIGGSSDSILTIRANFTGPGVLGAEMRFPEGAAGAKAVWYGRQLQVSGGVATVTPVGLKFQLTLETYLWAGLNGRVAVWAASDRDAWSWSVALADGASVSVLDSGPDVIFMTGEVPASGAHAHAALGVATASVSDATYELEVTNRFVGRSGIVPSQLVTDRVTVTRPDGTQLTCPCYAPDRGIEWGPGTYVAHWQGASLGSQRILFAGIDIDGLPPAFP